MTYPTVRWQAGDRLPPRVSVTATVARLAVGGLLIAVVASVITGLLARRASAEDAARSFRQLAAVVSGSTIAPLLTPELLHNAPQAADRAARTVAPLLAAGPIVRMAVWDRDGRLVWSAPPAPAGTSAPLSTEARRALRQSSVVEAGDIMRIDGTDDVLTADVGVRAATGTPMVVELSARSAGLGVSARTVWWSFAPATLGALVALELLQIPVTARLVRRLRQHQEAESVLVDAAVEASAVERRRVAGEVHDTVLPELTGMTYQLDAARLTAGGGSDPMALLSRTADGLRSAIATLRGLSVEFSRGRPPDAGLGPALRALTERAEANGIRVDLYVDEVPDLPPAISDVLFRCAQETLRNVTTHSKAEHVELRVTGDARSVTLVIDDDGRGFDEEHLSARQEQGHLGLESLGGLVTELEGSLTATSAPGQGTRVTVHLPLHPARAELRGVR